MRSCSPIFYSGFENKPSCNQPRYEDTEGSKLGIKFISRCVMLWQTGGHAGDCPRVACGVWCRALVDSRGSSRQAASTGTAVAQSVSPGATPVPHLCGLCPTGEPNMYRATLSWVLIRDLSACRVSSCTICLPADQVAGNTAAEQQHDRVTLLRCWLLAALDSHCRSGFADLTQQLGACSAFDALALGTCDAVRTSSGILIGRCKSRHVETSFAPWTLGTARHEQDCP